MSGGKGARSARGLFRATGKATKPVTAEMLGNREARDDGGLPQEPNGFYPTPPEPTRALISAERNRLSLAGPIWEPAVGNGAMQREMEAEGFATIGSDLIDRGCGAHIADWFAFTRRTRLSDTVVTNPPFDPCNIDPGWVRHGWQVLGLSYMALLLPVSWPFAAGRAALWRECPPARVYGMRWRIDWTGQGAPPTNNAWFVWDRRAAPGLGPHLLMLDRPRAAGTAELFSDAPHEAAVAGLGSANAPAPRPKLEEVRA